MSWYVYILRCCDGTLYTGSTNNVPRRLPQPPAPDAGLPGITAGSFCGIEKGSGHQGTVTAEETGHYCRIHAVIGISQDKTTGLQQFGSPPFYFCSAKSKAS